MVRTSQKQKKLRRSGKNTKKNYTEKFFSFFYCSGFCHTLKWNSHGFTCVPHPNPPSHLPLHPIPLYRKVLNDPDNHNAMVTHLKPDILECEVKWALWRLIMNKASEDDRIPAEIFIILKDDVKVVHSIFQQIWKIQQWPQDWKNVNFQSNPKKDNAKGC